MLDTCAVIYLSTGSRMRPAAQAAIRDVVNSGEAVAVSPFSAWEIGMLSSKRRLILSQRPEIWFDEFISHEGVVLAPLPPSVLIASSYLPGAPPKDPWDRIIAATAREFGYVLLTRDRALLAYGEKGHMQVLPC